MYTRITGDAECMHICILLISAGEAKEGEEGQFFLPGRGIFLHTEDCNAMREDIPRMLWVFEASLVWSCHPPNYGYTSKTGNWDRVRMVKMNG